MPQKPLPLYPGDWEGLQEYLALSGPAINVKDKAFKGGAKIDGVTDDLAATQAAIDACSAAGGGIVQVPPGTMIWSSYPTLKANVWLRGAGKYATTIKLKNGANATVLYNGGNQSNLIVSDLAIDGNKANQTGGTSDGISFGNASKVLIQNVRVINCQNRGIILTGSSDTLITGCEIVSCGGTDAAISVDGGAVRSRIIGNWVETPTLHGIYLGSFGTGFIVADNVVRNPVSSQAICIAGGSNNQYVTVQGNYCTSTLADGNVIDVGNCTDVSVAGNVVNGGSIGIESDTGSRQTWTGNVCRGCNSFGLAANSLGTAKDFVISGNVVSNCVSGIGMDGVTGGVISGNLVKNSNGNPGIDLRSAGGAVTHVVISGNRCYDDQGGKTQTYGLRSQGTCDFLTVTDNDFVGNLTGGASLVGANNKVRNNQGYVTENGGTSTQTPGAVAVVNIAHGLAAAPTNFQVNAGDTNARGAPSVYLTADATNLILNFSANLTGATSYTWRWRAEV